MDIFISYKREDRARISPIADKLKSEGFTVYFDDHLGTGSNFILELNAQLRSANAVVVAWSGGSVSSPYVVAEAMTGFERNSLVPIRIEPKCKPPVPFGAVHTADLFDGPSSEQWPRFVGDLKSAVDRSKAAGNRSPMMLTDAMRQAKAKTQEQLEQIVAPIRHAIRDPRINLQEIDRQLSDVLRRSSEETFSIVVVGRMKVGKSTLINTLLGPADVEGRPRAAPLPVDDDPCTATLSRMRYQLEPSIKSLEWANADGITLKQGRTWTFEEYHKSARIYDENGNDISKVFEQTAEFDIGWPAPLLKSGVVVIDSPGISDRPQRTSYTKRAVAEADAAIVVYRSEPFAGSDETEFAEQVTAKAGKVFTLINLRGKHKMPASPQLINIARQRLNLNPNRSLEEQDVYFAHFLEGEAGTYRNDAELVVASGLGPIQLRLARFLIEERMSAHVKKTLRTVEPLASSVDRSLEEMSIAARVEAGQLKQVLEEAQKDIERLRRKKDAIDTILKFSQQSVTSSALASFEAHIGRIADRMPDRIKAMTIPNLDSIYERLKAGTFKNTEAVERVAALIKKDVDKQIEDWATAPVDKPGLEQDIDPAVQQMRISLSGQAEDIAEIVNGMHRRVQALDPKLHTQAGIVGIGNMMVAGAIATFIFGPFGAVIGVTGLRGLVGAVAGTAVAGFGLAAAVAILNVAFPPTLILTGIAMLAAGIGAIMGGVAWLEERLKKKAWEQIEPKLRAVATDEKARQTLREQFDVVFSNLRSQMTSNFARLVAAEEDSLRRLGDLSRSQVDKTQLIEAIEIYRKEIAVALDKVRAIEAELDQPRQIAAA